MKDFLDFVAGKNVVILDGAMGTELIEAELEPGPGWNLERPEVVLKIHQRYAEAGADVIITNTFTANRLALTRAGLTERTAELNEAGVKLARQAAGAEGYVAGDMSSTGEFLEPAGSFSEAQFLEVFREQARALADAGVDLFVIETMGDPREMGLAISACKEIANLPVLASMAFDKVGTHYRTLTGATVADCVRHMSEAGADCIGANCGSITPEEMAQVIQEMRGLIDLPLIAQPNAGGPELIEGKVTYGLPAHAFVEGVQNIITSGATLVGGCCGTTPAHIKRLAEALR